MPTAQPPSERARIDALLKGMFDAAIAIAQPAVRIPQFLPEAPRGRLIVIGVGKASAAMARAFEDHWPGKLEGLVMTRYGYAVPCERIEIVQAAHPVPDENGLDAATRLMDMVSKLSEDDLVVCLISGGGSALLPMPMPGLTLLDKQRINQALLDSGASISEMNCVRRHLSAIKGGRLAAACHPARVLNLLISDVPADGVHDIASGPTVADPTSCADALAIVDRYEIELPPQARAILSNSSNETPKPGDPRLARVQTHLIATPQMALEAAADFAARHAVPAHILSDAIEGEAREVGKVMAAIARQVARGDQPFSSPCVILSGGETTVTVRGTGRGGRNVEFLLSLGIALNGEKHVYALAGDTDGVDGREEIAGALLRPDTLERARREGRPPMTCLENNDAHGFFQVLGDSVITGPTMTNVNDFRAIYVSASDNPSAMTNDK
ncbi:glycerate kinase type-2 family protein [Herbaspirillum frisingense]|uniref:glycerate kinase type-2 family protein n=1 Tax=Herbaspirillum frisingense TaxID=92645 RepID=UPI001F2F3FA8|nr:glycerate kinase [Herbaspirillum frisingense]UIN23710.1 glycerate kinase [Herbaspirillum frisingense]